MSRSITEQFVMFYLRGKLFLLILRRRYIEVNKTRLKIIVFVERKWNEMGKENCAGRWMVKVNV